MLYICYIFIKSDKMLVFIKVHFLVLLIYLYTLRMIFSFIYIYIYIHIYIVYTYIYHYILNSSFTILINTY